MNTKKYLCEITYSNKDFLKEKFEIAEYEKCVFKNSRLAGVNLSATVFINCDFTGCDLSNAKIIDTVFRDVNFKNCKLAGLQFSTCNKALLAMGFDGSQLNMCSFYNLKLRKTIFNKCDLSEVDFVNADLSNSEFNECNLSKTLFENSNLSNCDFSTAYNYAFDPEKNKISKAKFSPFGITGLLGKYDIIIEQ